MKPTLDQLYTQSRPSLDSLYGGSQASTPAAPKSLSQQVWEGVSGFVSSVEQPFVSLAAAPVQGLAKVLGQPDPYAKGIPAGLPGGNSTASVSPLNLEAKTGDLLKAGSTVGAVAAAPATIPGAIGVGAAIGGAQGAGQAMQQEQSAGQVAKQGGIGALIGGATAGAFAGLGKLFGLAGDKIQTSILKPSKADIEDGFSLHTLDKFNLRGSLNTTMQKTQSALGNLTEQLNAKLAGSSERIDLNDVFRQTMSELTDASKLKGFGANTKVATGLEQLQREIQIVNQDGGLSIPDAQIIKQASGTFGAWQYGKPDPEAKATEIIYNTFYNKLKTAIEQNSPEGVKEINQHLSKLIPVMNAVIRRLPVAERNNLISLNEMIGLVGSTVNPVALGPTILAILSRSGLAAKALSKVAPGIGALAEPAALATGSAGAQVLNTGPDQSQSIPQSSPDTTTPKQAVTLNPFVKEYAQNLVDAGPLGIGSIEKSAVGLAGKAFAHIHPDDIKVMDKFIAAVSENKPYSASVDSMAQHLAEHWGINVNKSAKYIAQKFKDILDGKLKVKGTFPQGQDELGHFMKK